MPEPNPQDSPYQIHGLFLVEYHIATDSYQVCRMDLVLHRNLNTLSAGKIPEWTVLHAVSNPEEAEKKIIDLKEAKRKK